MPKSGIGRRLALPLLMLGGLAGCATEPAPVCNMSAITSQRQLVAAPAVLPDQPSPLLEMPLNSANVTDAAIINKIYVKQVNARRSPTGTVEVLSQVVNCTDYPLNVEARTQFYDQSRFPSEPVSAWRRVHLDPRSYGTYREFSIGTRNVDAYQVEIREGR